MPMLNEKTELTKKNIHIMVTMKCDRNCPYCCNKQYNLSEIPIVTDAEMHDAENVFLTGGEPFSYANPCLLASQIKNSYPNIQKVFVYGNAYDFVSFVDSHSLCGFDDVDGLSISIKDKRDQRHMIERKDFIDSLLMSQNVKHNRLYVFPGFDSNHYPDTFVVMRREWQKDFIPYPDSIFRRSPDCV